MKQLFRAALIFLFSTVLLLHAAPGKSVFKGFVRDMNGEPLMGANVLIKELYIGAATAVDGSFTINVKPGDYRVEITFIGYRTVEDSIRVRPGEILQRNYKMAIEYFEIGGIVVVADNKLMPSSPEIKTKILSGEIEHLQAGSLSDVMKLVPGQRFENPGLQEKKQVSIRSSSTESDADRNAMFGTQVVIDNIPVSNNANMQLDTRVNTGTVSRTTENSGVDLRQIPADNIAEVEVIRGIPSAKYGDLTSGIIKVKTKAERTDHRFKYKYNLQNRELNVGGGFKLFNQYLTYNLNYANSVRDIRIEDYDFTRLAGQLSHDVYLFKNLYLMKNRLYITRTFDEQGLRDGDLYLTELYNRDYIIRYNHNSQFILSTHQRLDLNYSYNVNRQNSYVKKLITGDNTYISDRLTEGTQEGYYVQNYMGELWVKGRAYNHYVNLEYNDQFTLLNQGHKIVGGFSYRLEGNNGQGRSFDPMTPPSINSLLRDRPRSYDDIPELKIAGLYLEDRISGRLGLEYQIHIGARIEQYGSGEEFLPDNHGLFVNPRFNLILKFSENAQWRAGYGTTSKAPSLSMLYPNDIYIDIDDINRFYSSDSNLVVVSTYIYDRSNPNLQGSQQIKRESSFDLKVGKLGFTLTGYSNTFYNGFAATDVRTIFQYKYDYPNWPETDGAVMYDSVYTTYNKYTNSQTSHSRGVELSVQTAPFSPLDIRLRVDAAYNFTKSDKQYYDFASAYRFDNNLQKHILPFWNVVNLHTDNLLINYRAEFKIKELGAWVTLEAQQVVFDRNWYIGLDDSLAVGYLTAAGEMVIIPEQDRADDAYQNYRRVYEDYWHKTENQKNLWLFNLRVSKALFRGTEVSFYVNNIFNYHPLYQRQRVSSGTTSYTMLNPDLYFGVEFSGKVDQLFGGRHGN
ncbi:MAG: TonB-dependent receptor [Candidatus Marinimicrobia bacterium]|nr:TonB-dependent receptor [Candidatus Neomarinimicrobiota bacterium]